jgi:hypothetical protein
MANLDPKFVEDRELRDAALAVLKSDIGHAKETFKPGNIASRVGGQVAAGAEEVFELAKDRADDNRGVIAVLLGAITLFLARGPILEILGFAKPEENDGAAQDETTEPEPDTAADEAEEIEA